MGRGIERKQIFINDTDRSDFLDRLAALAEEGAMDVYAWVLMPNIFTFYVRPTTVPCLRVLSFFGQNRYRRRNYQEYVQKGAALGRRPELVGGGLVRSLGGWSEVLALRGRGEKQRSDQRILGDVQAAAEGMWRKPVFRYPGLRSENWVIPVPMWLDI